MREVRGDFRVPSIIHLYHGVDLAEVNVADLVTFLQARFPQSTINLREEFCAYWLLRCGAREETLQSVAKDFARTRVYDPAKHSEDRELLAGEVDFEAKFLFAGSTRPVGIVYDGFSMMAVCAGLLSPEEAAWDHCHIMLTNQLLGTWAENDHRYHIRAAIYGLPSALSTTGIIEGPAKPREYYLGRTLGFDHGQLNGLYGSRYIGYGDARLQEVMKGYLLQALFYYITGDPFCADKSCRLFNAHWQEEMIFAQLRPGAGLCGFHCQVLKSISGNETW
jgi:hypothetical protein